MTTANKITIARILMIPVFVGFAMHYARSVSEHGMEEIYRWIAIAVYLVASLSDGLDGFVARRFNQRSRLGVILDPLADKALLMSALLTVNHWPGGFPLWFVNLVVGRDAVLIAGALLLHYVVGDVRIRPHWTGKVSTFMLMVTIGWIMLRFDSSVGRWLLIVTGVFVLISAALYIADGIGQFHVSDQAEADAKP